MRTAESFFAEALVNLWPALASLVNSALAVVYLVFVLVFAMPVLAVRKVRKLWESAK